MSRPHPVLLDVAAGRPLRPVASEEHASLLKSAAEHRMSGLLWTRVLDGDLKLPPAAAAGLAKEDLRSRSHNLLLWRTLDHIQRRLGEHGLEVAVAKGVSTEVRWYSRTGERRCNDLDLVLSPRQIDRVDEVVRILQPTHPLRHTARDLMTSGVLQSIDLAVAGVEVDLHTDLLKYEIPTRRPELLFDSAVAVEGPGGVQARALSPEHSLVHFLLHLNKDNFARLLAYADIARILAAPGLDWQAVDDLAAGEGLRVHVYNALNEVTARLDLPSAPIAAPNGPRAALWQVLWPDRQRLGGRTALLRQRHRQLMIPWSAEGRLIEAASWWFRRRVLPPRALLDLYYAETTGPYPVRLVVGRWTATRSHRRLAREVASKGGAPEEKHYKTFPPKWAHIRVPTSSRGSAQAALSMYAPCLTGGYIIRDAAWFAVGALGPRVLPGRARQLDVPLPREAWHALLRSFEQVVGPFDATALLVRAQKERSGFAVLLLRDGSPTAFVRVRDDAQERFAHEQMVLDMCTSASVTSFWNPTPLARGAVGEWSYLAMTAFPSDRHVAARLPLTELLADVQLALAGLPRPPSTPPGWEPMHGDLTPWNCRDLRNGRRALIDWEDAGWGPPGADDVLFRATVAALSGSRPAPGPAEAVEFWRERLAARGRFSMRESIGASTLAALGRMAR